MKNKALLTYGIITRVSVDELYKLQNYMKENQIDVVFDKISGNPLTLVEKSPSQSKRGDEE